ncbi:MAG: hypothetical protein KAX44_07250 [Candidatus Brocadiae bacterium]|nr:hypothetical protein [Candidatus Brocadiia bacterium]
MIEYVHRQYGPWHVMFLVLGLGVFGVTAVCGVRGQMSGSVAVSLVLVGGIFFLAAAVLAYLEVRGDGDRLAVRFGPLPLFGTSIPYDAMESVERARTSMLYGFGMQGLPWLFLALNIRGSDAVQIRLKRRLGIWRAKMVFVGTDDAENLVEFLRGKMGQ